MKKVLALFLAILLAFSLFACKSGASTASPSASPSAAASVSPSAVASVAPSTAASASPGVASSASPGAAAGEKSTVGYLTDDVDHFARKQYTICHIYALPVTINASMNDSFKKFAEKMNFKFVEACSNGDHDQFVNLISTNIAAGVDAFCLNPMIETLQRDDEICKEANIPYINAMTPYTDSSGHTLNITVAFDGYNAGVLASTWFEQNYKKYFEKVDISSIGFMVVNFSIVPVFAIRANGALDTYKKNHPDLEKNIFNVDLNEFAQQNAYDKVAATLSANPDVKYWAIFGAAEDFDVGACRALEATGKAGNSIVISSGNDVCFNEWDNNTTPEWVATVPVYGCNLVAPVCAGLVALLDGRATPDTLWSEFRKPGETGVQYNIALEVVTRDNYKDFVLKSDAIYDSLK